MTIYHLIRVKLTYKFIYQISLVIATQILPMCLITFPQRSRFPLAFERTVSKNAKIAAIARVTSFLKRMEIIPIQLGFFEIRIN